MIKLNEFELGFFECALWSSLDNGGEPLDKNYSILDISEETILELKKDCDSFREECAELLIEAGSDEQNGHDFWLTRNGHGAGFGDRGYGLVGEEITKACEVYGSVDLYVGDDGKLYSFFF